MSDMHELEGVRAADWYEDPFAPGDAGRRRWWDGTRWGRGATWDGGTWTEDPEVVSASTTAPRGRRTWLWVLLGMLALAVAGCTALVVGAVLFAGTEPDADTDHTREFSTGESWTIAAQLVPVDGYLYQGVPEAEIETILDNIRTQEEKMGVAAGDGVTAVSLHSVKADDPDRNTAMGSVGAEVGFLSLREFADAPPAWFVEVGGVPGAEFVDEFDVGEVTVRVVQNDGAPQSRFTYFWVRHGVQGGFDGATRPETEQWVRAYLAEPVLVGAEDAALVAAAVPVPGYAYANADLGDATDLLVTDPVGDVPYSFHAVADRDETIGKLLLVKPGRPLTSEELAAAEASSISAVRADAVVVDSTDHGGVAVTHLRSSEADYYVWVQGDVAAVYLTTEHPDAAVPFIDAYLAVG